MTTDRKEVLYTLTLLAEAHESRIRGIFNGDDTEIYKKITEKISLGAQHLFKKEGSYEYPILNHIVPGYPNYYPIYTHNAFCHARQILEFLTDKGFRIIETPSPYGKTSDEGEFICVERSGSILRHEAKNGKIIPHYFSTRLVYQVNLVYDYTY